jgi:hypothetical protein
MIDRKRQKKKINFKTVIYEIKLNVTLYLYLHKKDTPHFQVPPVSYSPETGENITMLEVK